MTCQVEAMRARMAVSAWLFAWYAYGAASGSCSRAGVLRTGRWSWRAGLREDTREGNMIDILAGGGGFMSAGQVQEQESYL